VNKYQAAVILFYTSSSVLSDVFRIYSFDNYSNDNVLSAVSVKASVLSMNMRMMIDFVSIFHCFRLLYSCMSLCCLLFWRINVSAHVNSALHPSGVA